MRLIIVTSPRAEHQFHAANAIEEGCARHGVAVLRLDRRLHVPPGDDPVCCWGWRNGRRLAALGRRVLVAERAYLGNRFQWISLGWDGLNRRARFPLAYDNGARWRAHFAGLLAPWRASERGYALLMGQVLTDQSVRHSNHLQWLLATARALKECGHEVRFRPHPLAPLQLGVPQAEGSLAEALAGARFAVTFNSNSGVDAVLAGVPTVTMDEGAMAWDVSSHALEAPLAAPDREPWAHGMAYTQWLPEEIAAGAAWPHLLACMDPPRAAHESVNRRPRALTT